MSGKTDLQTFQFNDYPVRVVEKNHVQRMGAVDACIALGYENPRKAWNDLKRRNPELAPFIARCNLRTSDGKTRLTDTLDLKGIVRLCMLSQTARAESFRDWATDVLVKVIEKTHDSRSEYEQAVFDRKKSTVGLNRTIATCSNQRDTYRAVHDGNNRAVTGLTAREIQEKYGVKLTRDALSLGENGLMTYLQEMEVEKLRLDKPHTHDGVIESVAPIQSQVTMIRRKAREMVTQ